MLFQEQHPLSSRDGGCFHFGLFAFFLLVPVVGQRRVGSAGFPLGLAAADMFDDQHHRAERDGQQVADAHRGAAEHVAAHDADNDADDAEDHKEDTHELGSGHGRHSFSVGSARVTARGTA